MAAALVVLVVFDTALTGWLFATVQTMRRVVAQLGEVQQEQDHVLSDVLAVISGRKSDPWEGSRG